jgi:hypothetical protein
MDSVPMDQIRQFCEIITGPIHQLVIKHFKRDGIQFAIWNNDKSVDRRGVAC